MSKKILLEKYPNSQVSKALFKPYDFTLQKDDKTYYIKVLNVHSNTILSINSKYVWEIRYGKANGISFNTRSTTRLDMTKFNKLSNKIIVCKDSPYKILKYINESEVKDITNEKSVYDILLFKSMREINV